MTKQANRYNTNKLRWSLVDFPSLGEMVRVLEFGAEKYAPNNWKKGLNRDEILESIQRHLVELNSDQELDEESKLHHMGHVMCNAMFYLFHFRNNSFVKERANPFKKKRLKRGKPL